MITGKNKERFKEWLENNHPAIYNGAFELECLISQWGVYLEYYDSIEWKKRGDKVYTFLDAANNRYMTKRFLDYSNEKAQEETLKVLDEMVNKKYNQNKDE
jgi:hypothetical protein